ncbi:hypothetical protein ABPG75_012828 [Micractinium tetrahymenae]
MAAILAPLSGCSSRIKFYCGAVQPPRRRAAAAGGNSRNSLAGPRLPTRLLPQQRQGQCRALQRRRVAAAAIGGDGGSSGGSEPEEEQKQQLLKVQFQLLGQLIVRYPALIGSLAVAAGYFLKIDALGNLHWNSHDALLGLQCALPIMALDAALMLPDYSPGTDYKTIKTKVPPEVAPLVVKQEAKKAAEREEARRRGEKEQGANEAVLELAEQLFERTKREADAAKAAQQQQGRRAEQQQGERPQGEGPQEQQQAQQGGQAGEPGVQPAQAASPADAAADSSSEEEEEGGKAPLVKLSAVIVVGSGGPVEVSVEPLEALLQPGDAAGGQDEAAAAAGAAAGGGPGKKGGEEGSKEGWVEVERTIPIRAEQPPFLAALYRTQLEKATDNVGRVLPYPLELVLLFTWHLAEEMLYRAVVLTWAVGWTIDRLYEAGADETVHLLGMQLATPQAGALLAAVGCATVSLALLVQRALFPVRLIAKAEEELVASEAKEAEREAARERIVGLAGGGLPGKGKQSKEKERRRMRRVLEKVKTGLVRQRKWTTAIEGSRDVVEWAAYSTSFLLTGNLLAPYVTACSADLLFSGYQRLKQRQVDKAQKQSMETIRALQKAAMQVSVTRKASLQPPSSDGKADEKQKDGSVSANGSSNGSGSSGSGSGSSKNGSDAEKLRAAAEEDTGKPAAPTMGAGSGSNSKSSKAEE